MAEQALRQQNHEKHHTTPYTYHARGAHDQPYSPPGDPLTAPPTPSERQERDAADVAGALPSWRVFDRRV